MEGLMIDPDDVERDVVALVRAFHHGDQEAVRMLLEANDPLNLVATLAAFVNRLGAEQAGSFEAWDAYLGRILGGTVESS
jgi:hypothetical protein